MPSKELIEKVARAIIENPPKINRLKDMETLNFSKVVDHTPTAEAAISTILAEIAEADIAMINAAEAYTYRGSKGYTGLWRAMLAASALGEQGE
ncbi:hypothetical protein [Ochrobactrum sp. MC-1LL]|uniref:hypothetical protein n=1 Tax=Ochrobactrum sp. MC-1LL TaxID=2735351 RepID=UPI0014383692|nr:hypothetical protein [Ochrobactrum sp. MC-1LL]NKE77577.1 hypothetical protein [Ochrobactrum sp. MC-1LL]